MTIIFKMQSNIEIPNQNQDSVKKILNRIVASRINDLIRDAMLDDSEYSMDDNNHPMFYIDMLEVIGFEE